MSSNPYILGGQITTEGQRLLEQGRGLEPEAKSLLDRIGVQPGWKAIDVGCGTAEVPLVSGASGRFLSVSVLCQRRSARLKRTGERLASDSDQSDVYVCPRKGAGRHETQSIRVGN